MAITVLPITPHFAAEVGDVTLNKPLAPEDLSAVRAAFTKYAVLVFPDQEFDDESQLAFARNFGPLETTVFKARKDQPDEEITHDWVMDHCVIHGSVNKVVDQILALREEVGDFGELVYAGMDWVDPALTRRSMQLMAEAVMPRVNAAIGKAAAAA